MYLSNLSDLSRIMGTEEFVFGCIWSLFVIFLFAFADGISGLLRLYQFRRITFACDLRSVGETLPPCHWASCPAKEHCKYYQPTWVWIRNGIRNKIDRLKRQKGC